MEFRQLLTYSKYQQQSINPVSYEHHELLIIIIIVHSSKVYNYHNQSIFELPESDYKTVVKILTINGGVNRN
ncbi:MAG: hypothetical protein WAZ77_10125 [Candidatus Nitrosopolaris sp.]